MAHTRLHRWTHLHQTHCVYRWSYNNGNDIPQYHLVRKRVSVGGSQEASKGRKGAREGGILQNPPCKMWMGIGYQPVYLYQTKSLYWNASSLISTSLDVAITCMCALSCVLMTAPCSCVSEWGVERLVVVGAVQRDVRRRASEAFPLLRPASVRWRRVSG